MTFLSQTSTGHLNIFACFLFEVIKYICTNYVIYILGRAWAATTTEGLLIYSLDSNLVFDPFDLDIDNTPENIRKTLLEEEYSKAIMMALKLNENDIIREVLESIKYDNGLLIF